MTETETKKLTDEEVIAFILGKRDPKYFEVIYDRYAKTIFNKCLSFVHDKNIAEDLTHDILVRVYLSLIKFSNKSRFSTWLYSITYNACVDFRRKQQKTTLKVNQYDEDQIKVDPWEEDNDQELHGIQLDRLKLLMHEIPNDEKIVLLLKYQDDLSVRDICQVTELSESAIKMRLKRGRDRLVNMYQDKYAHNII